jgi:hypothetical protein
MPGRVALVPAAMLVLLAGSPIRTVADLLNLAGGGAMQGMVIVEE